MLGDEYSAYLDYFIPDYAAEIASNYGLSPADALARATQEISDDLPLGVETVGQVLLCLLDRTAAVIGYLWYREDQSSRSAFINDFYIFPALQGQGLGKQALKILESDLERRGFEQIKLRVADDNKRARHVYEATGFRVSGINMSKSISK